MTRQAMIGSATVHLGLVGALFVARTPRTIVLPGPDVVQVALLEQPSPESAPAAPAATAPDEEGVRIERTKPNVRKPAESPPRPLPTPPATTPPPPLATPQVALPYAPVTSTLAGQVAVDDANFEFAYYLQAVRSQIGANFGAPSGTAAGTRAEVHFVISRDGSISALRLSKSSGNAVYDQAALRAVVATAKLPPLPLGFAGGSLGIAYGFEFTGP